MKLATPDHLTKVTGEKDPRLQVEVLSELGIRAIYRGGRVRVYEEAILHGMVSPSNNKKPKLNV